MVGVPKSKGCATCRARKIRCDEKWPVCQQCRRSDRPCPGPSNPYGKFMDEGPRQRARSNATRNTTTPNERLQQTVDIPCRRQPREQPVQQQTPCTTIETVRTKFTTTGVFHTMKMVSDEPHDEPTASSSPVKDRISAAVKFGAPQDLRLKKQLKRQQAVFGGLPKHPALSGIEILTSRLVASISQGGPSNQIKLFGPFIGEVPRRLGSTVALTDAAACLSTTHDSMLRKSSRERINPHLYAKALKSLSAAIEDPNQVRSTSTLCATVLLAITEAYAMGACGTNRNFTTHMGGAARILELRGPQEFQNPSSFERALLRAVTVGVGLNAIFTGKEDLLTTPAWASVAFDTTGVAEPRASMFRISYAMSHLPSLTRDMRSFFASPSSSSLSSSSSSSSSAARSLLDRATHLLALLDAVAPYIAATLADPARVAVRASSPPHAALWPTRYAFADAGVAFVLWFYWNMRTIAARMVLGLHAHPRSAPHLPPPVDPAYLDGLRRDVRRMAADLCRSWEHARAVRPLGAMYLDVGLIVAYCVFAEEEEDDDDEEEDEEVRETRLRWILHALEELTEGRPGEGTGEGIVGREFRGEDWSAERVERLGELWTGMSMGRRTRTSTRTRTRTRREREGEEKEKSYRGYYGGPTTLLADALGGGPGTTATGGWGVADLTPAPSSASGSATASPDLQCWEDWSASAEDEGSLLRVDSAFGDVDASAAGSGIFGGGAEFYATDAWSPGSDDSFLVLQPMGVRIPWQPLAMMGNVAGGSSGGGGSFV